MYFELIIKLTYFSLIIFVNIFESILIAKTIQICSKMLNLVNYLDKSKNKIILLSTSILALQAFYIIFTLGIGHPAPDEILMVPSIKLFLEGGSWWEAKWFLQHYEHRIIIPNLIFFTSAFLDQGNSIHVMYLGWIFTVITLIPLYALLKKINENFTWLIIPITALMFNLGQTTCFTWGICTIVWHLTSMLIILTIFFISKIDQTRIALILAITCATAVSFTMFQGLLIWVVGIFGLFFITKMKKLSLTIWILSAITIISLYFMNYNFVIADELLRNSESAQVSTLLTYRGLSYILLFLSNGLMVQIPQSLYFQYIVGLGMILTIILVPIYLKFKNINIKNLVPWIQFGLYAILGAIILAVGRSDIVSANASRYIAWSAFAHIAAIVIGTIFLLYIYKKIKDKRKKLFFKILISILIILLILGISSSSYSGIKIGIDLAEKNSLTVECLTDPKFDLKCREAYYFPLEYEHIQELQNLRLGIFANESVPIHDPLLENSNWKNMVQNTNGFGEIEYIDSKFNVDKRQELQPKTFVNRESSSIDVGAWGVFGGRNIDVDSAYVFVDNQVHSNAYYGYQTPYSGVYGEKIKPSYYAGIGGIFMLEKLSDGCHDFSIRITHENTYYEILSDSQLCVESDQ